MGMLEVFSKKIGKMVPVLETPEGIMIDPDAIGVNILKSDDPAPGTDGWIAAGWTNGGEGDTWINQGWTNGTDSWLNAGWNASSSGWTNSGWTNGDNGRWMNAGDSK